jgi:hypothetical protein
MIIEHPNRQELTTDELQNLQKLQAVIDRVVADGKISKYEMELVDRAIKNDGKVLVEEITMMRQMIRDKINNGLLVYEWN